MTLDEVLSMLEDQFGLEPDDLNDTVIFENPSYADAIIGMTEDHRVVYSYQKMVASLMDEDHISYEEAVEFIDYNTLRSLPYASSMGTNTPVVMYELEKDPA